MPLQPPGAPARGDTSLYVRRASGKTKLISVSGPGLRIFCFSEFSMRTADAERDIKRRGRRRQTWVIERN